MRARGTLDAAQSLGVTPRSVAARHLVRGDRVGLRIERPQEALADIDAPDLAVRIQRRVPLVGGDVVVDVAAVLPPGPLGDHHVALDAGRPRWRWRHFAGGNSGPPLGEALAQDPLAEPFGGRLHAGALPHRVPVLRTVEQPAHLLSHLVAQHAPELHLTDPVLTSRVSSRCLPRFLVPFPGVRHRRGCAL